MGRAWIQPRLVPITADAVAGLGQDGTRLSEDSVGSVEDTTMADTVPVERWGSATRLQVGVRR